MKTGFVITLIISTNHCLPCARNSPKCFMYIKLFILFHSNLRMTLKSQIIIIPSLQMISRNRESKLP